MDKLWHGSDVSSIKRIFHLSWHTITATRELRERMGLCEGCLECTKNRHHMRLQPDFWTGLKQFSTQKKQEKEQEKGHFQTSQMSQLHCQHSDRWRWRNRNGWNIAFLLLSTTGPATQVSSAWTASVPGASELSFKSTGGVYLGLIVLLRTKRNYPKMFMLWKNKDAGLVSLWL